MKILRLIFDFYINASIHVALAVYAMLRVTEIYFDLPYNLNLNYFVFFGTITGYNFVKYAGVAKLHHRSLTDDLKIIQVFSFFCFLALCYFAYQISLQTLYFTIPFCLLTIVYAVPILSGLVVDYIFFSLSTYIILYGMSNGLKLHESKALISYMVISKIFFDIPIGIIIDSKLEFGKD